MLIGLAHCRARRVCAGAGTLNLPKIRNEPMYNYAAGSPERAKLEAALKKLQEQPPQSIPAIIGGKEVRCKGNKQQVTSPSNHKHGHTHNTDNTHNRDNTHTSSWHC